MRTSVSEPTRPQVSGHRAPSSPDRPPSTVSRPRSTVSHLVVAAGRPEDVVAFETDLVDFFIEAAGLLGVPKSVAAIYGIVFSSPAPLSFADIEARLNLSKGSVSQGLRVLREIGALKEVSRREDRAELFEPDTEMRKFIGRYLEQRLQQQLEVGRDRLADLQKRVPGRNGEAELRRNRIKQLQTWNTKARQLVPIARTFLKLSRG